MENINNGFDAEIDAPFVGVGNFFESLPDGYLANALAITTPRDVGRLSMVCSVFRSAAKWDIVWERFLPPDYQQILAEAVGGAGGHITSDSKKELYLRLCDHPVIIDGGKKSFSLDKLSGKKCYMLAARDLSIIWGDTPRYWRWIPLAESRFTEVVELLSVCWLEIRGRIDSFMLSKDTYYVAYLVYKSAARINGFDYHVEVSFGLSGANSEMKKVFLDPSVYERPRWVGNQSNATTPLNGPKCRQDGWLEIEMGEFLNEVELQGELEISMMEVKGLNWKSGLIIQGVEIRPKVSKL